MGKGAEFHSAPSEASSQLPRNRGHSIGEELRRERVVERAGFVGINSLVNVSRVTSPEMHKATRTKMLSRAPAISLSSPTPMSCAAGNSTVPPT